MTGGKRGVVALIVALALMAGAVAWAGSRCQVVPAADARLRLDIWGRELAGAKGAVAAHSSRRVAWVADRQGVVIEALFLATLQGQRFGPADRAPTPPAVGALCVVGRRSPWR